jgi:hypothetical protein
MALLHSPKIVTSGLVFYYDMGNTPKSWKGVPTTNVQANQALFTYNNVPSNVTATLVDTGEYYLGAKIYKQTLTPINATGVSQLSAGGNPGIGVYTANGGGTANTYTGYSIYFKLGVPGHTSPIFTNYSNVTGYQSTANYNYFADGWYRGHVIWYDTVTRTDSKFWAINPATATLDVPIVVYWCAPFREDRNDSTFVSPFVNGTRSTTNNLVDLTNKNTLTTSLAYASDNNFSFNGTSNSIIFPENSEFNTQTVSVEVWVKTGATTQNGFWFEKGTVNSQYALFQEGASITWRQTTNVASLTATTASYMNTSQYAQVVGTYTSGDRRIYVNGVQVASDTLAYTIPTSAAGCSIGVYGGFSGSRGYYYSGSIGIVRVYNKALTQSEVKQNFAAQRGRYNI